MKILVLIILYQLCCFCNSSKKGCTESGLLTKQLDSLVTTNFRDIKKDIKFVDSMRNVFYKLGIKEMRNEVLTIYFNFSQGNTNYANLLLIQIDDKDQWSVYSYKAPYNMKDSATIFRKKKLNLPQQEKLCWLENEMLKNKIFELKDGRDIKGYPSWTGGTGASIRFFYKNNYWTYRFSHPEKTEGAYEDPKKFMNIIRSIKEVFKVDLASD